MGTTYICHSSVQPPETAAFGSLSTTETTMSPVPPTVRVAIPVAACARDGRTATHPKRLRLRS